MAQCDEGQLQCTAEKVYEAPVFVRVCVCLSPFPLTLAFGLFIGHSWTADGAAIGRDTPAVSCVAVALHLWANQHTTQSVVESITSTPDLLLQDYIKSRLTRC